MRVPRSTTINFVFVFLSYLKTPTDLSDKVPTVGAMKLTEVTKL